MSKLQARVKSRPALRIWHLLDIGAYPIAERPLLHRLYTGFISAIYRPYVGCIRTSRFHPARIARLSGEYPAGAGAVVGHRRWRSDGVLWISPSSRAVSGHGREPGTEKA